MWWCTTLNHISGEAEAGRSLWVQGKSAENRESSGGRKWDSILITHKGQTYYLLDRISCWLHQHNSLWANSHGSSLEPSRGAETYKRQRSKEQRIHLAVPCPPSLGSYLIWENSKWCCSFSAKFFFWVSVSFCFSRNWSLSTNPLSSCSLEECVLSGGLHNLTQI